MAPPFSLSWKRGTWNEWQRNSQQISGSGSKQDVKEWPTSCGNIVFEMPFALPAYLTALKEKVRWLNF